MLLIHGRRLAWDFRCVDTLAPSYLQFTSVKAGAAAERQEAAKRAKYPTLCQDFNFEPIIIETLGSWGPQTELFIRKLSKRLISASGDPKAGSYFLQRLSVAIVVGNAISVRGTLPQGDGLFED